MGQVQLFLHRYRHKGQLSLCLTLFMFCGYLLYHQFNIQ